MTATNPEISDVDLKENFQAAMEDSRAGITTAFEDMNTVERRTIIDIQSSQGTSILRDIEETTGTGAISAVNSGEIQLTSGTTTGSDALIETAKWGQYVPGYIAQAGMGGRFPTQPSGDAEIKWGYFNGTNGFVFGYDSTGLFVERIRDGVSAEKTYREDWNGNDPNDLRPEEITPFTPDEGAIWQIDYAWYGYGAVEFRIVSGRDNEGQTTATVHQMSVDGQTTITNPNQPIRMAVDNGTTTDDVEAYLGGRQFSILGEATDNFRITAATNTGVTVADGTWTHIQSIRRKASDTRRINAETKGFDISTDADARVALVLNPNLSGTSYGPIELTPASETVLEQSEAGTFDGIGDGIKIWEGYANSAQGSSSAEEALSGLLQVIPRDQPLSLIAQGDGASATVSGVLRVREEW